MRRILFPWLAALLLSGTFLLGTAWAANGTEAPEPPSTAMQYAIAVLLSAIILVVVCVPSRKGPS